MTTSSSIDFNQTRNEIITDSLCLIGVYRPGATVSAADLSICSNYLNSMIKFWIGKGIHMWAQKEGTLFLRDGVNTYTIGGASSDRAGDDVVETLLTAASSGTSLTVTSTVGMSANDQIGIELDDDTRQWTTILSVDSSTTLTLNTSLTSTASSGNTIFSYTRAVGKPLHISSARLRTEDGIDKPLILQGREEFMQIPDKSTESSNVIQATYVTSLSSGTMYVWPTPDNCAERVKFSYQRTLEDFDASTDTPDLPSEWLHPIKQNLAVTVAPIYGKDLSRNSLTAMAAQSLLEMQLWDTNGGSIRVVPNDRDDC